MQTRYPRFHLRHFSIEMTIPPLCGLVFKPEADADIDAASNMKKNWISQDSPLYHVRLVLGHLLEVWAYRISKSMAKAGNNINGKAIQAQPIHKSIERERVILLLSQLSARPSS